MQTRPPHPPHVFWGEGIVDTFIRRSRTTFGTTVCPPCAGPEVYYYEVVECGRRVFLTGVLIFISPNTAAQVATACMFAFVSLLGFELLRPHLDPVDSWLYRLVSYDNEGSETQPRPWPEHLRLRFLHPQL